jgi:murein L,D-transpeptidase YafK
MKKTLLWITACVLCATGVVIVYNLWPEPHLKPKAQITRLAVYKSKRQMLAFDGHTLLKRYRISLGFNPVGKKHFTNDGKTPEGLYYINAKNPHSIAHKNLGISYPNNLDKAYAMQHHRSPGGDIKIHGLMNNYAWLGKLPRFFCWTNGCIGLSNNDIDEVYLHTAIGTPIEIYP